MSLATICGGTTNNPMLWFVVLGRRDSQGNCNEGTKGF
ncbi:hypothetical protein ART_3056 [Arthrobacter sp. PAMC 25486]|nr:hypothetical protein ART_3056 [Arthrobacter sp. PAMC 25486]